ncbi:MAG: hypothetical protein ACRC1K_20260 [Planctomycetia bacterium]
MAPSEPDDPGAAELASALELLHRLLDSRLLQEWQPARQNAVY